MAIRLLVTGGRGFADRYLLFSVLDRLDAEEEVGVLIHGDARGADRLAGEWAESMGIPVEACPADWERHGNKAGPIRNQAMLEKKPDLVVAFPGGTGTADMVRRAYKAGIAVRLVEGRD